MSNSIAVAVGLLVGIGAWLLMSYLDTTDWITAAKILAQWVCPIALGVGTAITIYINKDQNKTNQGGRRQK
jgi:hypothetical protein